MQPGRGRPGVGKVTWCHEEGKGHPCLEEGTKGKGWEGQRSVEKTPGWGASPAAHGHLLRHSPGAFYEFFLGVGITGTALQGTCLGDQSSTAMAQLLYSVLDVGAYL